MEGDARPAQLTAVAGNGKDRRMLHEATWPVSAGAPPLGKCRILPIGGWKEKAAQGRRALVPRARSPSAGLLKPLSREVTGIAALGFAAVRPSDRRSVQGPILQAIGLQKRL